MSDTRLKLLICLLLLVITLAAHWQVVDCKFVEYDDLEYVTENQFITKGLGPDSFAWAFSTFRSSNWHPLTWISHMVDYQIYGLDPRGHHLTSLLFHIANALILFLVFSRMTGSVWRSAFVAGLFAVHPLHVESVAWVAERKDVLSTFFWLITMYAYVLYARRPSALRYVSVMVAFALALMSKPMSVSLPIVLLLLDYWPLHRASLKWRLVWEKAPLLAMSAASCIITFIAQRSGGAMTDAGVLPFGFRVGNAAISYVAYIAKMVWPGNLAVFYPLFGAKAPPMWQAIGAGLLLAGVTLLVLRCGSRRPYLAVGWLWYMITLVPVIGLVQVGLQAMADRYTYITLTGLFIILAWGMPDLMARSRTAACRALPALAVVLIVILAACTWSQVGVWHDSYSLFDHAIKVTSDNSLAYNNRGWQFLKQGRHQEAIADFSRAVEILPNYAQAHNNLGFALIESGKNQEGIGHVLTALRLGLDTPSLRYRLAYGYSRIGEADMAAEQCRIALRQDPAFGLCHNLLGAILGSQGRLDESILHLKSAAKLAPTLADPHGNLAMAYAAKRDFAAAWREVHIFEDKGGQPNPRFIAGLTEQMPDPGQ